MFQSRIIARTADQGWRGLPARLYLARPFSGRSQRRVAIYYEPNRIGFAQIYPFLHYEAEFREARGAEIRCVPVEAIASGGAPSHRGADVVLLETWFDRPEAFLRRVLETARASHPDAVFAYVDSFAHNDLRLARLLEPEIDFYLKKSLFADRADHLKPWRGDTNLSHYYSERYGIEADWVDWRTPPEIVGKRRLSPHFFTGPQFIGRFEAKPPGSFGHREGRRDIDLHARLGAGGSGWYRAMRRDAVSKASAMADLVVPTAADAPWRVYLAELERSKLCFSPFGYGELCWRDIESVMAGAVLVKPDMSHLETRPDLFEPGVTYLPVAWDFSDLEAVVRAALADPERRETIARAAFARIANHVRE